jgi:ubiquinone/menaquinone biosynthesis C-methylase UbiE
MDEQESAMADTEQVGRRYDTVADRYEDIFFYVAEGGRCLVDYADPAPGIRMLDVGSGRGAVVRAGLARGCHVTAVDASSRMVEWLGKEFPHIVVRQMDAGHLDFADHSFDLVTAGFVMEVLDDPAGAIAEFRRVLVPGGVLALSLERPTVGGLPWLRNLHADFFPTASAPESTADSGAMSADQLDELLTHTGLLALTRKTVTFSKPLPGPQALWRWLAIQGLAEAVATLPKERAEEFRARFFAAARHMQDTGGIAPEFVATLHRARVPE